MIRKIFQCVGVCVITGQELLSAWSARCTNACEDTQFWRQRIVLITSLPSPAEHDVMILYAALDLRMLCSAP